MAMIKRFCNSVMRSLRLRSGLALCIILFFTSCSIWWGASALSPAVVPGRGRRQGDPRRMNLRDPLSRFVAISAIAKFAMLAGIARAALASLALAVTMSALGVMALGALAPAPTAAQPAVPTAPISLRFSFEWRLEGPMAIL